MSAPTVDGLREFRYPSYETRYANELVDAVYAECDRRELEPHDPLRAVRLIPENDFFRAALDVTNRHLSSEYEAARLRLLESNPFLPPDYSPSIYRAIDDPIPQKLIDEVGARCAALLAEKEKNDD